MAMHERIVRKAIDLAFWDASWGYRPVSYIFGKQFQGQHFYRRYYSMCLSLTV